ncbi:olfactory receptor 1L6-like [Tiliqua scincoides]|uniref:olfactory receptor 1L6-like n=1 Tax=Tiliqua scincoides TaxID=71010 RepID=UPI003461823E
MDVQHNQTIASEFILLGITDSPELRTPLFVLFLALYALTVTGNILTVAAIQSDAQLSQSPMYFFLTCLSLVDVGLTSVIVPTMLLSLLGEQGETFISYSGCLTQLNFFLTLASIDSYLLAAMAVDRYVAICNPLQYTKIMNHRLCLLLLAGSCSISHLHSLFQTMLISRLTFAASANRVPHFFCDILPLMKLSCSDTSINELVALIEALPVIITPFMCVVISYVRILVTVLKVSSAKSKCKAFSTCGSHLTVVILFYGSVIRVYFRPMSSYTAVKDRVVSVVHTILTPMLNPFIYSLRNADLQGALRKLVCQRRN